jgi:RimJ/RimL family protein N-acetyltransferase
VKRLRTARLTLRRATLDDAPFVLELVNDPAWLRYIGDKGVHSLGEARAYLETGPIASYARNGFGLYLVERAGDRAPLGLAGLIRRDGLADVDIGFALAERARGQGFAVEAGEAVLGEARGTHRLRRVAAITVPENGASIRVLERLGLRFEAMVRLPGDATRLMLFARSL